MKTQTIRHLSWVRMLVIVTLTCAFTAAVNAQSTYDSVGNAMKQVKEDFSKADAEERLQISLEIAASSLPLTPGLLHIGDAICAAWYVNINNIILRYSPAAAAGDSKALSIVEKANKLRDKLGAVCDPHNAPAPEPGPNQSATGTPSPAPPVPQPPALTPEEKQARDVDDYCALRCRVPKENYEAAKAEREALDQQFVPLALQAAMQGKKYEMDPSDKEMYQKAVDHEKAAKAAYDECMRKCYEQAAGAKLIPQVPEEFKAASNSDPRKETGAAPPTKTPRLGEGTFKSVQLGPGDDAGAKQVAFVPPIAGPGSTIVTTVIDPNDGGPQGVLMGTVDQNGKRSFFKGVTDNAGKLALTLPLGITAFEILRVDHNGAPTTIAHTDVGTPAHVIGAQPVPTAQIPKDGPAIVETTPAIEMGGTNQGTVVMHTRGTDPLTTQLQLDDKPTSLLAASDLSVVAKLPADTTPGPHKLTVASDGVKSNSVGADATIVTPEPIPLMHSGSTANVVLHVEGIPQEHKPTVHFTVGGAAKLAGGAAAADVPVKNGVATVKIQGVHPGQVVVNYQLSASIRSNNPARSGKQVD